MLRKKILLVLVAAVIIPILLLTIAANKAGQEAQEKVLITTLETGLKIVRGEMRERKNGMRRVCSLLANSGEVQKAVLHKDRRYLSLSISSLKNHFEYVDYIHIVNRESYSLAQLSADMRYTPGGKLGKLVEQAMKEKRVIFSEELLALDDLFIMGSRDYEKFIVQEKGVAEGSQQKVIRQALISLVVVPIYLEHDMDNVIGAIIVGDIFNNDEAFPNNVSSYSQDAMVLASTGGIRIASNFAKEGGKEFIGTSIAHKDPYITKQVNPKYLSTLNVVGVPYKFLNEVLYNSSKQPVGFIGVGLPEASYFTLNAANDQLFILFSLLGLVLLSFSICYVQKYLNNLEEEKESYKTRVKEEYNRQVYLSNELRHLNSNLEVQVKERTEHLTTIVERLKQTDATRTRFLAGLSHELRTPLNIIISSAQVLQDEILGSLNIKQKNYVQSIYSSGDHLLSTINNLLRLSKGEFGKDKLHLSIFCLQELIEEVVRNARKYTPYKKLNITAAFREPNLLIQADMLKVRQIIYNLISNAVKFTEDGGKIEVQVAKTGNLVCLVVEDNGIGMDKEDLSKVFSEFSQGQNAAKSKYQGTGLGLTIAKYLVEQHGGTIYLESSLHKGCKVTVLLPINRTEDSTEIAQEEE